MLRDLLPVVDGGCTWVEEEVRPQGGTFSCIRHCRICCLQQTAAAQAAMAIGRGSGVGVNRRGDSDGCWG